MSTFEQYAQKYQTVKMERRDGILQMTFHTDDGPLQCDSQPHGEFSEAFRDIGNDPANKVVIMTGTGDMFSGPQARMPGAPLPSPRTGSNRRWDLTDREGKHLLMDLLDIEVPMISAINGPAYRHSELPLLCDIMLAADTTVFQDSAHFDNSLVRGDGVHVIYPLLLGANRGRYFLLTGQTIAAQEAKALGLVSEVLIRDRRLCGGTRGFCSRTG